MSCAHEPLRRWWFFQHFAVKFTVPCWHLTKSAAKGKVPSVPCRISALSGS